MMEATVLDDGRSEILPRVDEGGVECTYASCLLVDYAWGGFQVSWSVRLPQNQRAVLNSAHPASRPTLPFVLGLPGPTGRVSLLFEANSPHFSTGSTAYCRSKKFIQNIFVDVAIWV